MTYSRPLLAKVVAAKLAHHELTDRQVRSLAAYLLQAGHAGDATPLSRDVNLKLASLGRLEVAAVSAHPLAQPVLRDIRAVARELYPSVKRVTIVQRLDSTLVGGVRVTLGEYELDLSMSGRFQRFTRVALGGTS